MRALVALLAGVAAVFAQDVGLGARKGSGARFEAPYTLDVETPHVKWARPLEGGPIRLLAVPTVREGRTLIELAQRLDLDSTAVTIDPAFDRNKWTMCFGRDYGARAERGDLSLIHSYLEAELAGPKPFEVILLQLSHGWEALTPASREALARRVREGAGLVLIRPFESELSPLESAQPVASRDRYDAIEPRFTPARAWRRAGEHYITRAIPIEAFPFAYLEEYGYRAAPGAQVLIQSESGKPVLAVQTFGKGRVAAFGYRNAGLSWLMPMHARGYVSDLYWEYFYALLCRTLLWAAGRDAEASALDAAGARWRLKAEDGQVLRSGAGRPPRFTGLAPGRYFVEKQTRQDFEISAIDVPQPDRIEELRAAKDVITEGDAVEVTWRAEKPATVELVDGLGRVIGRAQGTNRAVVTAGRPLGHSGLLRAAVGTASAQVPVRFAAATRDWTDYEVIMPWYGPGSYQPWIPALDEQFRKVGITALASPERNFKVIASAGLHDVFGVYAYRNANYARRKKLYAETGDKQHLTRDVVLQAPDFAGNLRRELGERLHPLAPLKPLAYYIADESSLTSYTDAFDVDWAPEALEGFRAWLQREYGTLDKLNAAWSTSFSRWEDVIPMTAGEAQKHGNFAPWADHRAYMEQEFVRALGLARDIVQEIDPRARASISGTQVPTAHNGCNWYEIDQRMDYLQPYSGGNQDAMHHLFRPGILLTGFTGYGLVGAEAQYQQWQRLFYGHTGASIFWHYTILNPDLALSEQGKALAEAFGKIQAGIGRVFMNSAVREDGVAIHFSMASIRGAWITDGRILPRVGNVLATSKNYAALAAARDAWAKELERRGIQFRFLATPQIEAGALEKFRVLILPYSIAISDREAREIERFLDRGGVVYADEQAGRMDERCRWRREPLWASGQKGIVRRGPGDVGIRPQFAVDGEFLTTVRDFGEARLIGLLPRERRVVELPPADRVRYDLLRSGLAAARMEAGPDRPVLLVERARRIARLEVTPALELRLEDEAGAPVNRSVVRIELFDPAGRLARHYSANLTVVNGRAKFEIPFALNDARGAWRVRARDVISGLTAERVLRR